MNGFFTLHRDLMQHWCASDPNFLAVWVWLINDANWQDKKSLINSSVVEVKRGQLIYGRDAFSKKSGVSVSKLRRIIKILDDEGMISQQKTNKYSIISITKYDDYQSVDQQNTNKTPTKHQQNTTPKQLKQNKPLNKDIGRFEEFWSVYPKREGGNPKSPAMDKFIKAVNDGANPDSIIASAKAYAASVENIDNKRMICQAITWLNQKRWKDEHEAPEKAHLESPEDWGVDANAPITMTMEKYK